MVDLSSLSNQSHYPSPELLIIASLFTSWNCYSYLHQGHRDRCAVCVPQKRERVRCTVEAAIFVCLSRGPAVADLGFSPGGAPTPKSAIIFQFCPRKLHENERIWTPGGGGARVPGAPLRSANGLHPYTGVATAGT